MSQLSGVILNICWKSVSPEYLSPRDASLMLLYADNFQICLSDISTKPQMPTSQSVGHFHQDILLELKI